MAKINRAALRFGLTVAGVAIGTSMLGHLLPAKSSGPDGGGEGAAPGASQAGGTRLAVDAPAVNGMLVKNTASGGRLIVLGHTDAEPAVNVAQVRQAQPVSQLPRVRTRRS